MLTKSEMGDDMSGDSKQFMSDVWLQDGIKFRLSLSCNTSSNTMQRLVAHTLQWSCGYFAVLRLML